MRPLEPAGSAGTTTALLAGETPAFTGLAALETVADFEVLRTEGKTQSYRAQEIAVSCTGRQEKLTADCHRFSQIGMAEKSEEFEVNSDPRSSVQIRGCIFLGYFSESAPAFAHCASCALVAPEAPIAPTILPSTTSGNPPSTGVTPCSPKIRRPSPPAARPS